MNKAITKGGRRFSFKCANRPDVVQSGRDEAQLFVPVRFVLGQWSYMPHPTLNLTIQPHLTELHIQEVPGDKSKQNNNNNQTKQNKNKEKDRLYCITDFPLI